MRRPGPQRGGPSPRATLLVALAALAAALGAVGIAVAAWLGSGATTSGPSVGALAAHPAAAPPVSRVAAGPHPYWSAW